MHAQLVKFVDERGRFPNAIFATPDEQKLHSWILTQRNAHYGIGNATLSTERAQLLEAIDGWEW